MTFKPELHRRGHHSNPGRFSQMEKSYPEAPLERQRVPYVTPDETQVVIDRNGDEIREVRVDGKLHNPNGPAVVFADGRERFWVEGQRVHPPEEDYTMEGVNTDGSVEWRAGDNRTVTVEADGSQEWRRDGDLHRDGGPAVVSADGEEEWYIVGTPTHSPIPAPSLMGFIEPSHMSVTGPNANEAPTSSLLRRSIREDIDHAVDTGWLPGYAAQVESVSVGESRDKSLTVYIHMSTHHDDPEVGQVRDRVTAIAESYNRRTRNTATGDTSQRFEVEFTYTEKRLPGW